MTGDHAGSAGARHKGALLVVFAITASYMTIEAIVGFALGSLALLSDAGHMLTDVIGVGMALAAIQLAESKRKPGHTYGLYRLEILAAALNAVLLFAVAGYVLYEAVGRFSDPPEVAGAPLLIVATIGLLLNVVSFRMLRAGSKESLNIQGAFLEVVADMIGSLGVVIAGLVLLTTGWPYADPIIGAGIGLFILPRAFSLGREALRVLLELAPAGLDVDEVEQRLSSLPGIAAVHDLHVWTITSGITAASGHLVLAGEDGANDLGAVLRSATQMLEADFSINHVTMQCEPADYRGPENDL